MVILFQNGAINLRINKCLSCRASLNYSKRIETDIKRDKFDDEREASQMK